MTAMPPSLRTLVGNLDSTESRERFERRAFSRDEVGIGRAAVLVLLTSDAAPSVLLTERAAGLRHHGGQVSFPGGGIAPGETAAQAALREVHEEVGLGEDQITLLGEFPPALIQVSRFTVRTVVGCWTGLAELTASPDEVAQVVVAPVADLADPAARFIWRHPIGLTGPGFQVGALFVWGFTAFVLDAVLAAGGWARPWDDAFVRDVPPRFLSDRR
jgi:8-oxo-dGTP pyrophosphatase MutT (NUDIX family)